MKTAIVVAFGALVLLTACQDNSPKIQIPPKWPGAAYHLSFGPAPAKPNVAGLTIPPIKWDANPDMVESRADLVVQFDTSKAKSDGPVMNFMTMAAVDINGAQGALPADYVDRASTDLSKMLTAYCINGKVKISVALTRSSLAMNPTGDQIDAKRLSDWTPIELDFKNPQKKCAK
ncbi:MAG: hypothetical protein WBP85_12790 [Terracidiphilus sp.]